MRYLTIIKILGVYIGSVLLGVTGCSSAQFANLPQSSQEWCAAYEELILVNAQNLKDWLDLGNNTPFSSENEIRVLKSFREAEMELVASASKLGVLNQTIVNNRTFIDRAVIGPAVEKFNPVDNKRTSLDQVITQGQFLRLVNDSEKTSRDLGYSSTEDFVNQFVNQVDNQCGFNVYNIIDSSPKN
jgi:hypothetical protein